MRLLDPMEALRIWCTRSEPGSIFVPLKRKPEPAEGEKAPDPVSYDYDLSVSMRVDLWLESQPRGSAEIIRHVVGLGRPASDFAWRGPGETRMRALISWGWAWAKALDPMPEVWQKTLADFVEWWERSAVQACAVAPIVERQSDLHYARELERLTLDQAAEYAKTTPSALRGLINRGSLPAHKFGGKWYVVRSDLLHI